MSEGGEGMHAERTRGRQMVWRCPPSGRRQPFVESVWEWEEGGDMLRWREGGTEGLQVREEEEEGGREGDGGRIWRAKSGEGTKYRV